MDTTERGFSEIGSQIVSEELESFNLLPTTFCYLGTIQFDHAEIHFNKIGLGRAHWSALGKRNNRVKAVHPKVCPIKLLTVKVSGGNGEELRDGIYQMSTRCVVFDASLNEAIYPLIVVCGLARSFHRKQTIADNRVESLIDIIVFLPIFLQTL